MSFPYMNAMSVSRAVVGKPPQSTVTMFELASGQYNLFSVPGVVDVSAMEFDLGARYGAGTGAAFGITTAAATAEVNASDGGPSGDATTVAALFSLITNTVTTGFTLANKPQGVAGTSTTDLDADDWVNLHLNTGSSAGTALGSIDVGVAFIYGKPAGIN